MASQDHKRQASRGLVGGSIEQRLKHSRVPPLESPFVLAPFRRATDEAPFTRFVSADAPLHVEIGFGRPHHLCDLAAAHPDDHVLGFEIRRRWVSQAARRAAREQLTNLRAVEGDARTYVQRLIPSQSVRAFYVLFPDPWWKKRHHKRRVFQPEFLAVLDDRLEPGGLLVAKTDVEPYAELIGEMADEVPGWSLIATSYADPVLGALPRSHREKKCAQMHIPIFQFCFQKRESDA